MTCRDPRQAAAELSIFKAFLKAYPSLAEAIIKTTQPCEAFPDIRVTLRSGSKIDFELGEWLEEQQMQERKKVERVEGSLLPTLGEQASNASKHFRWVMMVLKDATSRFDPADSTAFPSELYALIEETDRRWQSERFWHSPQGRVCRNFESYPTVGKYLSSVHFEPIEAGNRKREPWPAGHPWIFFKSWCGSYSSQTALEALLAIIGKKQSHYGIENDRDVRLLIHYGRAVRYNTPYYGIDLHTFEDVAARVADALTERRMIFKKVYLLEALEPGLQAFKIYPKLRKCQ